MVSCCLQYSQPLSNTGAYFADRLVHKSITYFVAFLFKPLIRVQLSWKGKLYPFRSIHLSMINSRLTYLGRKNAPVRADCFVTVSSGAYAQRHYHTVVSPDSENQHNASDARRSHCGAGHHGGSSYSFPASQPHVYHSQKP